MPATSGLPDRHRLQGDNSSRSPNPQLISVWWEKITFPYLLVMPSSIALAALRWVANAEQVEKEEGHIFWHVLIPLWSFWAQWRDNKRSNGNHSWGDMWWLFDTNWAQRLKGYRCASNALPKIVGAKQLNYIINYIVSELSWIVCMPTQDNGWWTF